MNWYKIANYYTAYHGSPKDFHNFSYEYLGTHGTAEGFGFYFTNNREIAEGYANKEVGKGFLKKVTLDIKKPLNPDKISISRENLSIFLKTLDPTGDGYLSNWGETNYKGYDKVVNMAIDGEMSAADNDIDLISGIIQGSGRNAELINRILKQTLGYDGIIIEKPSWGENQIIYVVFDNSQIINKI